MVDRGLTDGQIASKMGRTAAAIGDHRRRLGKAHGGPRAPWTVADAQRIRAAYRRGESDLQIGAAIGRTRAAVEQRRQQLALTQGAAPPWTRAADRTLRRLYGASRSTRGAC